MRGSKKIFSLFFIAAISFSCATLKPQLKPHVIKKNLENKTKDEVFINCIKALKKKNTSLHRYLKRRASSKLIGITLEKKAILID